MRVAILCGGRGSRLRGYTEHLPKPLVHIGDQPIIWHVMSHYAAAGHRDFVLCLGYRGDEIRRYVTARGTVCDTGVDFTEVHTPDGWTIRLLETGLDTMTGGRLRRAACHIDEDTFLATYADGVADVDVHGLIRSHTDANRLATVTVVNIPPRFGIVRVRGDQAVAFAEKPMEETFWINGGFFVFDRRILELIDSDDVVLEREPLSTLASSGQLTAFYHHGFWQCMDTPADIETLEELWSDGNAPWLRATALNT